MTCQFASSGCNGPKEGDCLGLCLHRLPIEFAEPEPKDSRTTCALCAYRTHRPAGRLVAVRQAFKAWRMK